VRRRLLFGALALVTFAITTFFVPAAISLRAADREAEELELLRRASDAAALVDRDELRLASTADDDDAHRYALYAEDGRRLSGDGPERADEVVAEALAGTTGVTRSGGDHVAAVPLPGRHALRVAEPASEADARTAGTLRRLGAMAALTIAVSGLLAAGLATRLTRPLSRLAQAARKMGGGDFIVAPERTGVPEVDEVSHALAASAARIGGLVERERQLTADASHQLRTPLAGLRVALEGELAAPRPDPRAIVHEALGAVDRLEATVTEIVDLAREAPPADAGTDLAAAITATVQRWSVRFAGAGRSLDVAIDDTPPIRARGEAVRTVVDVLLDNALTHGAGTARVRVAATAGSARLTVTDDGSCNAPEDVLFGRRRSDGGGSGIGLHLARTVAEADGARLRRTSEVPTTFELLLPSSADER
jgi:signal transduction histidine kinase